MSERLRLYFPHPVTEFPGGRGISEALAGEVEHFGFDITQDYQDAEISFFVSDSMLDNRVIGKKPCVALFWGWHYNTLRRILCRGNEVESDTCRLFFAAFPHL